MKLVLCGVIAAAAICAAQSAHAAVAPWWSVQSVDTMKYSRDASREALHNQSFDAIIEKQMKQIASTGATHVAIATPYDEEFYPVLKRWADSARRHGLSVWFRGNWSGWEKWFEYTAITRVQHLQKTKDFLQKHGDLFQDGDIFTACPECENGGPGDPRATGDVAGYRAFVIEEYAATKAAFAAMHKDVASNWQSMNADVARTVMDPATTKAMDGLVVIDHYVKDPAQIARDVEAIAKESGGMVALGEFGAPIPDIHGQMTEAQQAQWIDTALKNLLTAKHLVGISYWVNVGGSTKLWTDNGTAREAVVILKKYYSPQTVHGLVQGVFHSGVSGAIITSSEGRVATTDARGFFAIPYIDAKNTVFTIKEPSYSPATLSRDQIASGPIILQVQGFLSRIWLNIQYLIGLVT
ncbi:hypothetical protein A2837_00270 [Candidatus Kaiserbacteria bacterium RIFCSPHIGHO2_01_FULL_46_22]|uniref:Glycoside hydrolase family 5 domain-containing protein n=2 Tax=Parcubacteria group TaxID=1794811 RepID=A0A1F6BXM4_9BACT|nr:MAG: hypothetical protein A2837_00270 [Candidatus Kaiserbacteria bacterium RIFCSPHIGHO2_01_FULL_46_22]OGY37274.1 MAG: hypothetical protein A3E36_01655 [Candidatus Andersenbacteria bacterium RIFCSPHIGHO2_12_FULL_45_11b]